MKLIQCKDCENYKECDYKDITLNSGNKVSNLLHDCKNFQKKIELNSNGVNKEIKGHILSDKKMKDVGFIDIGDKWYFSKDLKYNNKIIDISFSISIPKDNSDIGIDVLDENFCQPYDYQRYLYNNPEHEYALAIKLQVEEIMQYLQDSGVISGFEKGMYI